ncbi:MAG: ABC transporter substrate-binding protein [Candidatus Lokiarchaeota archaeon]|nr:ABC transporter substrate-binding protein [Candidatus Lokiarchaeota archaeon]
MERNTKRIIVVVALIAVIGGGIGIGVFILLQPAGEGTNVYEYPGLTGAKPALAQTVKIGLMDDMTYAYGQLTWIGMKLAAGAINGGGGVDIGGTTYYIGVTYEDTKEAAYLYETAYSAALRMIEKDPDVIIGGFRSEVAETYIPVIMAANIPFIGTGCATTDFCSVNVKNNIWPYFFRTMPQNSFWLGNATNHLVTNVIIPDMISKGIDLNKTTIIYEELIWTIDIKNYIIDAFELIGNASLPTHIPGVTLSGTNITAQPISASWTKSQFDAYWGVIDGRGDQLVIPIISDLSLGRFFGDGYNNTKPDCLVAGINVAHQLSGYLSDSGGCEYEISFTGPQNVSATPGMVAFWNTFVAATGGLYEPVYTSLGAYDAVMLIANVTDDADSLVYTDIVAQLETITETNFFQAAGSKIAFDQYHDVLGTIPGQREGYFFPLFIQFDGNGIKQVLPSAGGYPPVNTSSLMYPDWWNF